MDKDFVLDKVYIITCVTGSYSDICYDVMLVCPNEALAHIIYSKLEKINEIYKSFYSEYLEAREEFFLPLEGEWDSKFEKVKEWNKTWWEAKIPIELHEFIKYTIRALDAVYSVSEIDFLH